MRRFLQHVLPDRFVRIRHYGFLANRARKQKLPLCRRLIARATGHNLSTSSDCARRSESEPKRRSVFDPPRQCRRSVTEAAVNGGV